MHISFQRVVVMTTGVAWEQQGAYSSPVAPRSPRLAPPSNLQPGGSANRLDGGSKQHIQYLDTLLFQVLHTGAADLASQQIWMCCTDTSMVHSSMECLATAQP